MSRLEIDARRAGQGSGRVVAGRGCCFLTVQGYKTQAWVTPRLPWCCACLLHRGVMLSQQAWARVVQYLAGELGNYLVFFFRDIVVLIFAVN
jgi:hypothetical protein